MAKNLTSPVDRDGRRLESPSVASGAVTPRDAPATTLDLEPFRRELTGYCYRMLGSGFEAEDAVQETMLRAWRSEDRFEGRSSLRSWLYRIASNVCIDMQRSVQRRARPMEMGPDSQPVESMLPDAARGHLGDPDLRCRSGSRVGGSGRGCPVPRVDPAGLHRRPPAPSRPLAGGTDPLRGPAMAGGRGGRGGRAAGHQCPGGQQRPAAGSGHAARPHGRRRT
jgi:hypothetical protein